MRFNWHAVVLSAVVAWVGGCLPSVHQTDREVARLIAARQQEAICEAVPAVVDAPERMPRPSQDAYDYAPHPTSCEVPEKFRPTDTQPAAPLSTEMTPLRTVAPDEPAVMGPPDDARAEIFTLEDALAYAQLHRREYQTAKEDLYLAALALTLEQHLWTPIFSSDLRTVYGNYGEAQDFDQAMRFVADLGVAQRLPYGGEFTAKAIATLIRDVGQSITAEEGGDITLGLNIPFLRGAGHVARERLIQLERDLTYAVRTFERFRRQQLVRVAQEYFALLLAKQTLINTEASYENSEFDFQRAKALEATGKTTPLDTALVEDRMLTAQNSVELNRENFRSATDQFKLLIGMPLDTPLERENLSSIESIEEQIEKGEFPLLVRPLAVDDEDYAVSVAVARRLDLLSARDEIADARRGVSVSRNAMLPDLDWNSTLTFDTDPEHYNVGAYHFERANWRSELLLSLPLERTAERNALRRSLIDLRRAQRSEHDLSEVIRTEVRSAVNRVLLAERSLLIQQRRVASAERRQEYAVIQFNEGDITNREKVEAEVGLLDALNGLSGAKTARWNALLQLRLVTETLRVDENGAQHADPDMVAPPPAPSPPAPEG